jgi:iron complex transport system substrate-binding protein
MKKLSFLLMTLVFVLFLAACGSADSGETEEAGETGETGEPEVASGESESSETVTISHELGDTEVMKNPQNVVVFDFGILDTLDKLGVDVTGVVQSSTVPSYLEKYESDDYENIGSLKEPDFEKIAEINPEVIIISGRQASFYDQLSEIAPTVHLAVDNERYMESFKENMQTVGEIFGKETEIEEAVAEIDEKIASLQDTTGEMDEKALIVLANDDRISAYGSNSRFGIIHDVFGVPEADENIDASTHGMNVSFEYVMEQDPDILYVIDRAGVVGGETTAEELVENELTENTTAYQNDDIIYLNPEYWYLSGGGLQSVMQMVEDIETSIE